MPSTKTISVVPITLSTGKRAGRITFEVVDVLPGSLRWAETNHSELAAFASYALAFPASFLALVDTYDVLKSHIPELSRSCPHALRICGYQLL